MAKNILLATLLAALAISASGCLTVPSVSEDNNSPDIPQVINKAENVSNTIEERDQNAAQKIQEIEENF